MNHNYQATHSKLRGSSATRRRAFTIIELVVAMGIATVMMFLINRIFFDTTNAVSRGIGLSHIIGESRAFSSTLATDFITNQIVKPDNGGFMFIGFKEYTNVDFANPRRQVGTAIQQNVISDQMLLVLNISGQKRTPLTPRNDDTFSPYEPSALTQYGLLWYGHVARLQFTDSTATPPTTGGADAGEINNSTRNHFGHQWIVGRQLMFLDPDVDIAAPTPAAYIDGPYARSFLGGTAYNVPALVPPVTPLTRWMGLSDIINLDLANFTGPNPSVLDPVTAFGGPVDYLAEVARIAYVTERLRVAATVEPATSYASWNLAQTHAAFMSYCSDFQISFAGDFDGAGDGIDVEATIPGPPVIPPAVYEDLYTGGNIKWYGYPANEPAFVGTTPAPSYDPTKPAIYDPASAPGISTATTPVANPAPYYTDTNGELPTELGIANIQVDRGIVFRHDVSLANIATQWPHLIRIRYRLHDERGEIESTNGTTRAQGIWFEQIVRIQ